MLISNNQHIEKSNALSSNKFCPISIANLSIILFFCVTSIYSYFVYQHISFNEIILSSALYLIFLMSCAHLFKYNVFKIEISWVSLLISTSLTFYLFILMTLPLEIHFADYFRTFPLLESDLGMGTGLRGWYDDTVFHTSIIQNIINFGYPGIGQHGTPIMVYHVATHYFDALISLIVNNDPFDSYTLNSTFKRFVYLSSLLLFVANINKNNMFVFLLSALIFIPASVSSWHPVISHGLWLPTVIFILSAPTIFNLIISNEKIRFFSLFFLFAIVIFLSLGKVSLGFMLAAFIGFTLFLKNPMDIKVYLLGVLWLLFFYFYSSNIAIDASERGWFDPLSLTIDSLRIFLIAEGAYIYMKNGYVSFFTLLLCCFIYKTNESYKILSASIGVIFLAYFICHAMLSLSVSDKAYFMMATSSVVFNFSYIYLCQYFSCKREEVISLYRSTILPFSLFFLAALFLHQPVFNVFKITPNALSERLRFLNTTPFQIMNNSSLDIKMSLTRALSNPSSRGNWYVESGEITSFKLGIKSVLDSKNIEKNSALLYIPSDVYTQLPHEYGSKWAAGMFIYSITGVPLLNALKDEYVRGYGLYTYGRDALRISLEDFDLQSACLEHEKDYIIFIEKIKPLETKVNKCD